MPSFEHLTLRTERLLLRPLRAADAAALFAIHSDPLVMRYWSTPPWPSIEPANAMIERDAASMASGEHLRLGIERHPEAQLIGQCTLFDWDPQNRRAEIGYSLAPHAWGQGCMHEALCALVEFGFGTMALNRIEADIDPRNSASARSLERLDFQREGLLRERWIVGGDVCDTALYGLLLSDWRARA